MSSAKVDWGAVTQEQDQLQANVSKNNKGILYPALSHIFILYINIYQVYHTYITYLLCCFSTRVIFHLSKFLIFFCLLARNSLYNSEKII